MREQAEVAKWAGLREKILSTKSNPLLSRARTLLLLLRSKFRAMERNTSACVSSRFSAALPIGRSSSGPLHEEAAAVCVLGQTRLFGIAVANMYWALQLRTRPHHLFFVGPADASWELHRDFIVQTLNSSETRYSTVEVQNLGSTQPLWKLQTAGGHPWLRWSRVTFDRPKLVLNAAMARQFRGMVTSDGRVKKTFVSRVVQLWQQHTCLSMIRAHERSADVRFARVIKTRPDVYFFQQMPLLRANQLLWPASPQSSQDLFLDSPAAVAAELFNFSGLVEGLLRGQNVESHPLSIVQSAWSQRLQGSEVTRRVIGGHLEVVTSCSATRTAQQKNAATLCFLGLIRGIASCRPTLFTIGLESPDPEDYCDERCQRETDGDYSERQANWSQVPRVLAAEALVTAWHCFAARPSRGARGRLWRTELSSCGQEEQGDPPLSATLPNLNVHIARLTGSHEMPITY